MDYCLAEENCTFQAALDDCDTEKLWTIISNAIFNAFKFARNINEHDCKHYEHHGTNCG